jgi:hypothetical protein
MSNLNCIQLNNKTSQSVLIGNLTSNLYNGTLSLDAMAYLIEKKTNNVINNNIIEFDKIFSKEESYIYNALLDKLDLNIDNSIKHIELAKQYFIDYEISKLMYIKFDRYVNNINSNIWYNLTKKPDYNLCLFINRMLPYYSVESKEWKKAGIDAHKEDYPNEINNEFTINNLNKDYKEEITLINKNNNFLEISVLDEAEYPDMVRYEKILRFLVDNKLNDQAIIMVCRLMLSHKDCHIIKNNYALNILNNLEELKKYCLFYSMYLLRQEETIMFNNINNSSRIIFSLEEAHNMPNYSTVNLDINPYVTQLTDNTNIYKTMPFYLYGKRFINSTSEFNRRFKLVTGGIFEGINLRELNAAITGSILIPCILKSPLEHDFDSVQWKRERDNILLKYPYMIDNPSAHDEAFINYAEYYYPSYVSLNDEEFINEVYGNNKKNVLHSDNLSSDIEYEEHEQLYQKSNQPEQLTENAKSNQPEQLTENAKSNQPEQLNDTNINKVINNRENKSHINVTYNKLADIDISITTRDIDDFKNKVYILFNKIKNNAAHRGAVYINEIISVASVKYKIYGPGIPRPIDVFRIPYDPIKMIKKFHTNIVKMYYDGELYLLRSCVSTLLSGINENYKWFSCNKAPADVLLKYAQRGITIILNCKERKAISNYVNINDRWKTLFENIRVVPEKMFCTVTERHAFFRPGLFNSGIRLGLRRFERDNDGIYNNTLSYQNEIFNIAEKQIITHTNKKIYQPEYRIINEAVNYMSILNQTF